MRKTTQPYWVIVIDFESFQNLSMKIVIIGGVAAGAKVAAKSRRLLPDAEIDIYTQDTHVSYSPIVMCTDDHEGWNGGFGLFTGEHGVLGCYVHSGIDENAVFGGKLMTNRWNHVAATFDGRSLKLWIDGRNVAGRMLAARDETAVMTGAPLTFGTIGGGNGAIQPFVGAVADVRVWSSALSASSIADVYRLFLGEAVDPNADDDEDGLSNGWEVRFKLDPRNSDDASSDMDGDGFSNLREYRLGRNPRVGRSKVSHSIIRSCTVVSP